MQTKRTLEVNLCGERIELRNFIRVLRVGERIRVFCDDGVFIAEKISETQFALIDSQAFSKMIH